MAVCVTISVFVIVIAQANLSKKEHSPQKIQETETFDVTMDNTGDTLDKIDTIFKKNKITVLSMKTEVGEGVISAKLQVKIPQGKNRDEVLALLSENLIFEQVKR